MIGNFKYWIYGMSLAVVVMASSACSSIFFESPVPQKVEKLEVFPDHLSGMYEIIEGGDQPEPGSVFRDLLVLELSGDKRLVATGVKGFLRRDLTKLAAILAADKTHGKILDYFITESGAYYTLLEDAYDADEQKRGGHYISFEPAGDYLLLSPSREMLISFDLSAGKELLFEKRRNASGYDDAYFKVSADSLQYSVQELVAKSHKEEIWFSVKNNDESKWSLVYLKRLPNDELLVKHSVIGENANLYENLHRYNAITPFTRIGEGRDYLINPTDEQLKKLLADPDLFTALKLKKVSGK